MEAVVSVLSNMLNIIFYIVIMALVFGVMIFIHEAGHFLPRERVR